MKKLTYGLLVATLSIAAIASAAKSGLQPGEGIAPYYPEHVVGPLANKKACFPCTYKNAPQVQVFINKDSKENMLGIAKGLEAAIDSNKGKGFKAMMVVIADKAKWDDKRAKIASMAKENGINDLQISLVEPGNEALKAYKINTAAEVKNTVLFYKNWKVAKTHVNFQANEEGSKAMKASLASILS